MVKSEPATERSAADSSAAAAAAAAVAAVAAVPAIATYTDEGPAVKKVKTEVPLQTTAE